jgi:ADP-dependent NAD(P)H-hydrate dehydratase / NAD(P)H-hydrate epimerase
MQRKIGHGTPLCLTADIRRIEARHAREPLMERAGLAAATHARALASGSGKPILIFAGPGNNGGDAFVVARYLRQWFFSVTVIFAGDTAKLPADAAAAFAQWRAAGGTTTDRLPVSSGWDLVIDGLFGVGMTRDIEGRYADWISIINLLGTPVLALDVPSGLDADTGGIRGCCVRATHTITFIAAKPGLCTRDGPDHCGEIFVEDLDLDRGDDDAPGSALAHGAAGGVLAPRLRNTHKGSHGSVGIIGGDSGMVGAALLAGRAALKLGAGRVYVGLLARDAPLLDTAQPELMLRCADAVLKLGNLSCLAVGPGLGSAADAAFYLRCALEANLPLVIDADALNAIATNAEIKTVLKQILTIKVLTPHPAEAARLLACSTREVQSDRIAAASAIANEYQAHVVLKGAGSICASPGQPWRINTSGNPGMASAGMGDVLTGVIAALLAQGAQPQRAMDAAVWLHGAAADACVTNAIGPVGLTASETIDAARSLLNASATADTLTPTHRV